MDKPCPYPMEPCPPEEITEINLTILMADCSLCDEHWCGPDTPELRESIAQHSASHTS